MNANALEYFEVGHEEVVSLKQKRGGLSLYLLIDQEKHLLSLSTEAGEVLLPVLKKRLMVP